MNPIIIIGTGLAGYMLAKELRKLLAEAPITMLTKSAGNFYSKPLLSTALTKGKTPDALVTSSADEMAEQLNIEIRTGVTVTAIDTKQQCVMLGDEQLAYSKLVLACGADPIPAPLLGDATDEIKAVNDLQMYDEFRDSIKDKKRIAVLGAGLVGCEFANDLANNGYIVDVIAPSEHPLDSLLPWEVGRVLEQSLAENGVRWHLEELVSAVNHHKDGLMLTLSSQKVITTEAILSAIGLRPHTAIAEAAGIDVNHGILVDQHLQTNVENVYALGDCAEVNGFVMLFVAPLLQCARALAKTLSGEPTKVEYPAMPVIIKTPSCPIVVSPQPKGLDGEWQVKGEGDHLKALFHDTKGQLRGFVLTGDLIKERAELIKQLPAIF